MEDSVENKSKKRKREDEEKIEDIVDQTDANAQVIPSVGDQEEEKEIDLYEQSDTEEIENDEGVDQAESNLTEIEEDTLSYKLAKSDPNFDADVDLYPDWDPRKFMFDKYENKAIELIDFAEIFYKANLNSTKIERTFSIIRSFVSSNMSNYGRINFIDTS